jgi:hypothetical protein
MNYRVIGIGTKKWKFQQVVKGLKIESISDIWTIDKTHNKFLALKMRLNF